MGEMDETNSALMDIDEAAGQICNVHTTPSYDAKISNSLSLQVIYTKKSEDTV